MKFIKFVTFEDEVEFLNERIVKKILFIKKDGVNTVNTVKVVHFNNAITYYKSYFFIK